jgi:hypothetical protein
MVYNFIEPDIVLKKNSSLQLSAGQALGPQTAQLSGSYLIPATLIEFAANAVFLATRQHLRIMKDSSQLEAVLKRPVGRGISPPDIPT